MERCVARAASTDTRRIWVITVATKKAKVSRKTLNTVIHVANGETQMKVSQINKNKPPMLGAKGG